LEFVVRWSFIARRAKDKRSKCRVEAKRFEALRFLDQDIEAPQSCEQALSQSRLEVDLDAALEDASLVEG
jgi:hypothetical protein